MEIKFSRSSRKHRIGRGAAIEALQNAGDPTRLAADKLKWVGTDSRGRELELVGIEFPTENIIMIIHVMPTSF